MKLIKSNSVLNLFAYTLIVSTFLSSISISNAAQTSTNFSCASTNQIETVICTNPDLVEKNKTMTALYAAAHTSVLGVGTSAEDDEQKKWLTSRDRDCLQEKNNIHDCLTHYYDSRLKDLAIATLFQMHDLAMVELTHQDSKAAPVYEAIYQYVTLANSIEREKAINPLITQIFDSVHDEEWSLIRDMKASSDVVADDESFAAFLDTISVSGYNLTLPCEAIIRRPELINALGAKYGGAMDAHLIASDCRSTLPNTSKFTHLMTEVDSAQPPCHGSIRFSQGREYDKILNAISLHRIDLLGEDNDDDIDEVDPQFYKNHQTEIKQAITELSQYYVHYFHLSPETANDDAQSAVDAAIHAAFDICF